MIAAVVNAARITDPETVKEFELELVVRVKLWAYDPKDARKLAHTTSNWADWLLVSHVRERATGRIDG